MRASVRWMAALASMTLMLAAPARAVQPPGTAAPWSYEGKTGPAHWGDLDPRYALCKSGSRQSPIDITGAFAATPPPLTFHYQSRPIEVGERGHAGGDRGRGNYIMIGSRIYRLADIHFHHPSEHTFNKEAFALEAHLVHTSDDGATAVVAILIKPGDPSLALPSLADDGHPWVDPALLLPLDHSYYRYNGSLTTPPCTEGVTWFVMKSPIEMSMAQLSVLSEDVENTSRPTQPTNGRFIVEVK